MKALLEAKADVKVFAMDDMNAMHFAAQKGHAEVVRLLLNHGETALLAASMTVVQHSKWHIPPGPGSVLRELPAAMFEPVGL